MKIFIKFFTWWCRGLALLSGTLQIRRNCVHKWRVYSFEIGWWGFFLRKLLLSLLNYYQKSREKVLRGIFLSFELLYLLLQNFYLVFLRKFYLLFLVFSSSIWNWASSAGSSSSSSAPIFSRKSLFFEKSSNFLRKSICNTWGPFEKICNMSTSLRNTQKS